MNRHQGYVCACGYVIIIHAVYVQSRLDRYQYIVGGLTEPLSCKLVHNVMQWHLTLILLTLKSADLAISKQPLTWQEVRGCTHGCTYVNLCHARSQLMSHAL